MADVLVLLPEHYSREETLALKERDFVRAAAYGDFGAGFGGIAFVQTMSLTTSSDAALPLCPDESLVDCVQGLLQPLPIVPSHQFPGAYNFFALVTLNGGRQRSFKRHILGAGDPVEGVREARALVFGMEDIHAVVEVVGDDLDLVSDRLLELVDHYEVVDVRTFVCGPESTAGFGEVLGTARKPARKASTTRRSRG